MQQNHATKEPEPVTPQNPDSKLNNKRNADNRSIPFGYVQSYLFSC